MNFSYAKIKLTIIPDKELTLVIVKGLGKLPMMLISNLNPKSKKLTEVILRVYIKRWKIKEYFYSPVLLCILVKVNYIRKFKILAVNGTTVS